MTAHDLDRRTFVKVTAGAATATLLAGCADDGGDGGGGGGDDGGDDGGDTGGNGGADGEFLDDEPDYDGWFDDVDNYEGTVDLTGQDEVVVENGAGDTGLAFGPAAIAVDPGTTVVWEWTGQGGQHDVTHEDGEFESDTQSEEGATFEHTFDDSGTYRYYCSPHRAVGQKGAIHVV